MESDIIMPTIYCKFFKMYIYLYTPGEGNGNPLQYSCLENSMDWGVDGPQSLGSQKSDMSDQLSFLLESFHQSSHREHQYQMSFGFDHYCNAVLAAVTLPRHCLVMKYSYLHNPVYWRSSWDTGLLTIFSNSVHSVTLLPMKHRNLNFKNPEPCRRHWFIHPQGGRVVHHKMGQGCALELTTGRKNVPRLYVGNTAQGLASLSARFLSPIFRGRVQRVSQRRHNYSAASYSASQRICNDFRFHFSLVLFSVAVVAIVIIVTLISCTKLSSPDFLVHVVWSSSTRARSLLIVLLSRIPSTPQHHL